MNAIEIPGWSFSDSDMAEPKEKFNRPGGTAGKSLAGGLVSRRSAKGELVPPRRFPECRMRGLSRQPAGLVVASEERVSGCVNMTNHERRTAQFAEAGFRTNLPFTSRVSIFFADFGSNSNFARANGYCSGAHFAGAGAERVAIGITRQVG